MEKAAAPRLMGSIVPFDREQLTSEARLVGLRQFRTPTLEAVERRRVQLWMLSVVLLLGVMAIVTLGSFMPRAVDELGLGLAWTVDGRFRVLMAGLTFGFTAYVFEKERQLRRVTRLLVDERVLSAALSSRLAEVTTMLDAGKAMNSMLELDGVLHVILNSATSLLEAGGGSIMLNAGDDCLQAVCVHGNGGPVGARASFGDGIAGRVARTWEPLLISGQVTARTQPVESSMCVPLLHRSELLGVLNLNGGSLRTFTEYDLRALSLFAEQAASAIANARLYEAERHHVARLIDSERRKSEFLAGVSHDLRTPLTSLTGCTKMLKRDDLNAGQRAELVKMIERQNARLLQMVESLLAAARIEADTPPTLDEVDIVALVRELSNEYHLTARPFSVFLPTPDGMTGLAGAAPIAVLGKTEGLRRVLTNLLDNAFKHGSAPVSVTIATGPEGVEVEVRDHGPGIPAEDRGRVFERFTRLDQSRNIPGIGLGLSIVQGIVVGYGGTITIDDPSDGGRGTSMRMVLRPGD